MIKYSTFKGEIPKIAPHLLPDGYAQTAKNCRINSGCLQVARSFSQGTNISAFTTSPAHIFKFTGKTLLDVEKIAWLYWPSCPIKIAAGETWSGADRIYWSGTGGSPQQTILDLLGSAASTTEDITKIIRPILGTNSLPLAVDYPTHAPEKATWYTWGDLPVWGNGVSYNREDIVQYTKVLTFRCIKAHTPNATSAYVGFSLYNQSNCPKIWEYLTTYFENVIDTPPTMPFLDTTNYTVGDIIYLALAYPCRCIQNHVSDNSNPEEFEYKSYGADSIVQYAALKYQRNSTSHSGSVPPAPTDTTYWTLLEGEPAVSEKNNTPGYGDNYAEYWIFEYSGEILGKYAYVYTFVTAWGAETRPSKVTGPDDIKEREFTGLTIPRDVVKYPDNYGFPDYVTHVRLYRTETGQETGTDFFYVPYYSYLGKINDKMQWGSNKDGMPIEDVVDGKTYYDCNIRADGTLPENLDISINRMLGEALETLFYDPPPEHHYDSAGEEMDIVTQSYSDVYSWQATSTYQPGRFAMHNSKIYRSIAENIDVEPGVDTGWADSWEEICNAINTSKYLQGLTAIPGGILAGFIGNELYFSEPYMPHAWPRSYKKILDYNIVGIGVYGQETIICTKGKPYLITGVHPDAYTLTKLPFSQSCLSKEGIVSVGAGVIYPSPDGLFMVSGNQGQILTKDLYNKKQWQDLEPEKIMAEYYDNQYIGAFLGSDKIFLFDLSNNTGVINLQLTGFDFKSMFHDDIDDSLYLLGEYEGGDYIGRFNLLADSGLDYEWQSKKIITSRPTSFSCAMIFVEGSAPVTLTVYCDNVVVSSKEVTTTTAFKLPAAMGNVWEFKLVGTAKVYGIEIAESIKELQNG